MSEPRREIGVLYGFRALMVLLVCNYHIWQQGWLSQSFWLFGTAIDLDWLTRSSYVFVDGMLLLSGFLLFLPYARQRALGVPVPTAGRFYFNRLARIVPSYLAAVLLTLACIALPQGAYRDAAALNKDVLTHLTFTFTFWRETYLQTPLNGALWTVAVEMQLYLVFPLLARAAQKKPALTLSLMTLAGWLYRLIVYFRVPDTAMFINQAPAFLDVYALGMLGALGFAELEKLLSAESAHGALRRVWAGGMAALFALSVWAVCELVRAQTTAGVISHEELRLSQLRLRFPLTVALLTAMLTASQMPRCLQKLLDNRLTRFLSAISFNLYIWHQVLAVQLKGLFPDTLHTDKPLQQAFTLLAFSVALVAAMAATFGVEQPASHLLNQWRVKRERKRLT